MYVAGREDVEKRLSTVPVYVFSADIIVFHWDLEYVLRLLRKLAIVFHSIRKKFGYTILATFHFGVRNSIYLFLSTGSDGVMPVFLAARYSASSGDL
jgi:hypothetical protein